MSTRDVLEYSSHGGRIIAKGSATPKHREQVKNDPAELPCAKRLEFCAGWTAALSFQYRRNSAFLLPEQQPKKVSWAEDNHQLLGRETHKCQEHKYLPLMVVDTLAVQGKATDLTADTYLLLEFLVDCLSPHLLDLIHWQSPTQLGRFHALPTIQQLLKSHTGAAVSGWDL